VEQHGKNPQQSVIAVIPARYSSVRLPGKLLLPIAGKPLILHTLERAAAARNVDRVVVATDDERIRDAVRNVGGEAIMTSADHHSGSDRIAEVAERLPENSIIVNVQGDEPMISPDTIDRVVDALVGDTTAEMSTACEPIQSKGELLNANNVKVVVSDSGHAIYFSRSPMPFPREASLRYDGDPGRALTEEPELLSIFKKHVGIYAYRREYLLEFTKLPPTKLEQLEMLEQLRALEDGAKICVVDTVGTSVGVDTLSDLERVRRVIETPNINYRHATREDIPAVAKVHFESWRGSFAGLVPDEFLNRGSVEKRIKAFEEQFDKDSLYEMLVAEDADKGIVGFVDFGEPRGENGFDAELYAIYFLPEFQRNGIGSHLLRMCRERLKAHGLNSMCLDSLEVSPFRKFYEKMGGEIVGSASHDLGGVEFKTVYYGWRDLNEIK
jgi:3-deoxy-manno-octulosonate cytidylyltransferase (CMP-KDO synthetase)